MEREKLRTLGQQLINNDLTVDKFLFTRYFQDKSHHKNSCGTVGCALGHYALRSDEWSINKDDIPHLKEKDEFFPSPILDSTEHFGIDFMLAQLMFIPHDIFSSATMFNVEDICEKYGLHCLKDKPPAKEVGENILHIVNMDEKTLQSLINELH